MRPASSAFSSALCGSSSGPGDRSSLVIVRPSKRSKTEIERTSSATGQEGEEASAATGQARGVRPQARLTGKRSTRAGQGSAASAAAPKTRKRSKIPGASVREGLFFDPQQGAWCGMHALNNFLLNGRMVEQQDCRDAARLVCSQLSQAGEGHEEPISNHIDLATGWLSIDVINVLGRANLGLHVEPRGLSCLDDLRRRQCSAALLNWNQQHWSVLQRDPSGEGWMHTNTIEGLALSHGRRRRLVDAGVREMLEDIEGRAGGVVLHAITHVVGAEGR